MVVQKFFRQKVAELSVQNFLESVEEPIDLEFGPERGSPANVRKHEMTSLHYTKIEHVKT